MPTTVDASCKGRKEQGVGECKRIDDGGFKSNVAAGAAIALELVRMRFTLGPGCRAILTWARHVLVLYISILTSERSEICSSKQDEGSLSCYGDVLLVTAVVE